MSRNIFGGDFADTADTVKIAESLVKLMSTPTELPDSYKFAFVSFVFT